jgi:hypothetical protein
MGQFSDEPHPYYPAVASHNDYRPLDEAVPHSHAENLPYPISQNAPRYMPTPQTSMPSASAWEPAPQQPMNAYQVCGLTYIVHVVI